MANLRNKPVLKRGASINTSSLSRSGTLINSLSSSNKSMIRVPHLLTNRGQLLHSSDNSLPNYKEDFLTHKSDNKTTCSKARETNHVALLKSCELEDRVSSFADGRTMHRSKQDLDKCVTYDLSDSGKTRRRSAPAVKTSDPRSSIDGTRNKKMITSHTSQDVFQRLTNRGIADASLCSKRRHSFDCMDFPIASKLTLERMKPKSILKNAAFQRRESKDKFNLTKTETRPLKALQSSQGTQSTKVRSPSTENSETVHTRSEPVLSDKDILSKCQYRLESRPMSSAEASHKKVTFGNDVLFFL